MLVSLYKNDLPFFFFLKLKPLQPQYQNGEVQEGRQCGPSVGWWQWCWDICGWHSRGYLGRARRPSRRGPDTEGKESPALFLEVTGKEWGFLDILYKGGVSGEACENRSAAGLLMPSVKVSVPWNGSCFLSPGTQNSQLCLWGFI